VTNGGAVDNPVVEGVRLAACIHRGQFSPGSAGVPSACCAVVKRETRRRMPALPARPLNSARRKILKPFPRARDSGQSCRRQLFYPAEIIASAQGGVRVRAARLQRDVKRRAGGLWPRFARCEAPRFPRAANPRPMPAAPDDFFALHQHPRPSGWAKPHIAALCQLQSHLRKFYFVLQAKIGAKLSRRTLKNLFHPPQEIFVVGWSS